MTKAYYNEFDPNASAWLRELIKNGLIADGIVDERSITEVHPDDLRGFTQAHWFAGIGGWSHSLRLAGIPDDYPVWTASLPCQPFSVAGLQKGKDDERHLLPHFLELVRQCQPDRIFGEQVEGAIRHGWLDDLQTTMEAEGYSVGHCVLGAHSVGSFHQRQRLYWVANANDQHRRGESFRSGNIGTGSWTESGRSGGVDECMAYTGSEGLQGHRQSGEQPISSGRQGAQRHNGESGESVSLVYPDGNGSQQGRSIAEAARQGDSVIAAGGISGMGNTKHDGQLASAISGSNGATILGSSERQNSSGESKGTSSSRTISEWSNPDWLYCRDNKYRPIKPGIKPLVDGIPRGMVYGSDPSQPIDANETQEARVMRLKGYGNAIVPQTAAAFISAFMDI